MGAEPYQYKVPYEEDLEAALERLREQVFASGDYRGAEMNPSSPEEAMAMMEADGTASILDILGVSQEPDFCAAAPVSSEELQRYFGTERPTEEAIDESSDFWEDIERGQCRVFTLYEGDRPTQYYFIGYSFD